MADFMKRRISTDSYQFPAGAFKIYGGGKFYNGFAIGATTKLSVVNEDGLLKLSKDATEALNWIRLFLGTLPPNNKTSMYIDIAKPVNYTVTCNLEINDNSLYTPIWNKPIIYHSTGDGDTDTLQAGGELSIGFTMPLQALPEVPDFCSIRAIWAE